jgi:hypothetical protein
MVAHLYGKRGQSEQAKEETPKSQQVNLSEIPRDNIFSS